ncbi:MAG: methyl-accepting chemotaxis protein [Lachnospiraceae bacterium]|jgi:methyl-accepting chemotaxis protein|nr:methyl-accepting chemotaxis protein [Lachnospiraceae bacterium]
MMKHMRLMHRLILPIALLGIVALLSNILSIINIRNVNASASNIADNYMDGKSRLAEICQSSMDIHKMALSHIVATDYDTMIVLIQQIKEEESRLDNLLKEYERHVIPKDQAQYEALLSDYASFKHALVSLVCASASHKTQDAYALANGEVASYASAIETDIDNLNASIRQQTDQARARLSTVYFISLVAGIAAVLVCTFLVFADLKLIKNYVVTPIKNILQTIQESSGHIHNMTVEVLKRTQASKGSAADLSALSQELSATIQEVASNASTINHNTENVRSDVHNIVEECAAITTYTAEMNTRANTLQQSAKNNAETTRAKAEEILCSLNDAIEKSKSVDQIKTLTSGILAIAQQTRLIALNASVEAVNAGPAGKGFAVVAREVRDLAHSSQTTASQIQEINDVVTAAVHNLSENAQNLIAYMEQSVLKEFQAFVESGTQYKEDAAYIRRTMDEFQERTEHLKRSMSEIADSIATITQVIDEGANGISRVADNTRSLANDMEDITHRMGANQEVVEGLEKETVVFENL